MGGWGEAPRQFLVPCLFHVKDMPNLNKGQATKVLRALQKMALLFFC